MNPSPEAREMLRETRARNERERTEFRKQVVWTVIAFIIMVGSLLLERHFESKVAEKERHEQRTTR